MLVEHAKRELEFAGFSADDECGKDIIKLMECFASTESSSNIFAAANVANTFAKLARFEPLTPLTSNSEEWFDVSEMSGEPMWQSKRQPSCFSKDGGKTWYDLDAPKQQEAV